jgi:acyl carrier protein
MSHETQQSDALDARLADLLGFVLEVDPRDLSMESGPGTLENWDSMKHLLAISAVEQEFSVSFGSDDHDQMKSAGDIQRILRLRGAV